MSRTLLVALAAALFLLPAAAQRERVRPRRQPGLRRRRQRRGDVSERLRRALQRRLESRRRLPVDGPVRNRRRNGVAADAALGHGRAWAVLPRPTRIDRRMSVRRCRRPTSPARPISRRRAERSRSCVPRPRSPAVRQQEHAPPILSSRISSATEVRATSREAARQPPCQARPRPCARMSAPTRTTTQRTSPPQLRHPETPPPRRIRAGAPRSGTLRLGQRGTRPRFRRCLSRSTTPR